MVCHMCEANCRSPTLPSPTNGREQKKDNETSNDLDKPDICKRTSLMSDRQKDHKSVSQARSSWTIGWSCGWLDNDNGPSARWSRTRTHKRSSRSGKNDAVGLDTYGRTLISLALCRRCALLGTKFVGAKRGIQKRSVNRVGVEAESSVVGWARSWGSAGRVHAKHAWHRCVAPSGGRWRLRVPLARRDT